MWSVLGSSADDHHYGAIYLGGSTCVVLPVWSLAAVLVGPMWSVLSSSADDLPGWSLAAVLMTSVQLLTTAL